MILSERTAVRLFGDAEKAIGQPIHTLMRASLPPYIVTAVVKDPPTHTNLPFDAIINHNMIQHFSHELVHILKDLDALLCLSFSLSV